jgi:homoserine kinase
MWAIFEAVPEGGIRHRHQFGAFLLSSNCFDSVSTVAIMSEEQIHTVTETPVSVTADKTVRVFGPASLSNLGPGFDTLGLCIGGIGDIIEARVVEAPGVRISTISGDGDRLPHSTLENTAAVAAQAVLDSVDASVGIELVIEKGIPLGSGIGGSAASAVAGAWATNLLLGCPVRRSELVTAVLDGEAGADGARHGDNVLPALFGGLVLVSSSNPTYYRRVELAEHMSIALLLPRVEILTREARDILPERVSLADAIHNASQVAFLVDALRTGDWPAAGDAIMQDRLVEPVRARLLPCYQAVREAALGAGAYGCALSGSGPAMFAIVEDDDQAGRVAQVMEEASRELGTIARGRAVEVDMRGVQRIDSES